MAVIASAAAQTWQDGTAGDGTGAYIGTGGFGTGTGGFGTGSGGTQRFDRECSPADVERLAQCADTQEACSKRVGGSVKGACKFTAQAKHLEAMVRTATPRSGEAHDHRQPGRRVPRLRHAGWPTVLRRQSTAALECGCEFADAAAHSAARNMHASSRDGDRGVWSLVRSVHFRRCFA